jgi:hypothetical protein
MEEALSSETSLNSSWQLKCTVSRMWHRADLQKFSYFRRNLLSVSSGPKVASCTSVSCLSWRWRRYLPLKRGWTYTGSHIPEDGRLIFQRRRWENLRSSIHRTPLSNIPNPKCFLSLQRGREREEREKRQQVAHPYKTKPVGETYSH